MFLKCYQILYIHTLDLFPYKRLPHCSSQHSESIKLRLLFDIMKLIRALFILQKHWVRTLNIILQGQTSVVHFSDGTCFSDETVSNTKRTWQEWSTLQLMQRLNKASLHNTFIVQKAKAKLKSFGYKNTVLSKCHKVVLESFVRTSLLSFLDCAMILTTYNIH